MVDKIVGETPASDPWDSLKNFSTRFKDMYGYSHGDVRDYLQQVSDLVTVKDALEKSQEEK